MKSADIADAGGIADLEIEPIDTGGSIWRFLDSWGDDPIGSTPPRPDWLLTRAGDGGEHTGAMRAGKVAMITGAGGIGKTFLTCSFALAIATGRRWLGTFDVPEPGPVVLAVGEEDRVEIQRRLHWAGRSLGLDAHQRDLAASRIMALPLEGATTALVENDEAGNVREAPFLLEMRERLARAGVEWRAIVLDPLSRFAGLETEVSNAQATRFVQALETLLALPGRPAVVITHHTNKASRKPGTKSDQTAARGVSALTDGVRWQCSLDPVKSSKRAVIFEVQKTNLTAPMPPVLLMRERGGALRPATVEEYAEHFPEESGS